MSARIGFDHGQKEGLDRGARRRPKIGLGRSPVKGVADPSGLHQRQLQREIAALFREKQQSLTAITGICARFQKASLGQTAQDGTKALLGDPEHVEQIRDRNARLTHHEMQNAMVRATQPIYFQHRVGIAHEVPVGKEQQFDHPVVEIGSGGVRHIGPCDGCGIRSVSLTYFAGGRQPRT